VTVRAVVFDFYGTLSIGASRAERRAAAVQLAQCLDLDEDVYFDALATTYTQRATGVLGDLAATMRWLATHCGGAPTDDQVATSCELRRETEGRFARTLRDDALPTVTALHERGLKIGLISDCTHELPEVWPSLPIAEHFDATVFSIEAGLRKPSPQLYAAAAARLGVMPADCLYVGDGGSNELTGATKAGMTAYLLMTPDVVEAVRYDVDTGWNGPSINALSDVLELIG
jgi:putative hydrolase of the HAD superfamily